MAELRLLLQLLDDLSVTLLPRYIRSELNPADQFSRLTDRDAWQLLRRVRVSPDQGSSLVRVTARRADSTSSRRVGARLAARGRAGEPPVGLAASHH